MPELPEVEIAAREVRRSCRGKTIRSVDVQDARILGEQDEATFVDALTDARVTEVGRHGKHIVATLMSDDLWWVHMGMSGKLIWKPRGEDDAPHTRVAFRFDDGTLCFRDPRIFGRTAAGAPDVVRTLGHLSELGPDAWTSIGSPQALIDALGESKRPIKVALMDQASVAGLGNIQAAEALFRAGIHPKTAVPSLKRGAFVRLYAAIRESIEHTLAATEPEDGKEVEYMSDGVHAANPFLVYGRAGEACGTCATKIQTTKQNGRKTFFCPKCQPE